ncbi:hypothetical protein GWK47_003573 [Chionoecetes opilio]|uniref:Uncharacterized protein n=1 Tax=Chionoecetes opilio TaxID=41210 RepID=A0A8J5D2A3_CHIOP|nr:hypothetical protein GWK47_003573 [Chionoecetes opilio]
MEGKKTTPRTAPEGWCQPLLDDPQKAALLAAHYQDKDWCPVFLSRHPLPSQSGDKYCCCLPGISALASPFTTDEMGPGLVHLRPGKAAGRVTCRMKFLLHMTPPFKSRHSPSSTPVGSGASFLRTGNPPPCYLYPKTREGPTLPSTFSPYRLLSAWVSSWSDWWPRCHPGAGGWPSPERGAVLASGPQEHPRCLAKLEFTSVTNYRG